MGLHFANEYFTDIIKYVIWEDYGLTDEVYPEMFTKLTKSEIEKIEFLLQVEREKLLKHHLTYQAEDALTMLGNLYAKNYLFNKFIPIAKEMATYNCLNRSSFENTYFGIFNFS
ncbi:hypothetical protein MHK_007328 [Candidatus Magnetomorum sp. HK-1]|nr:hypothetical protein MHK_007328 [Candidatus Magnetomorum sp. HK-1]